MIFIFTILAFLAIANCIPDLAPALTGFELPGAVLAMSTVFGVPDRALYEFVPGQLGRQARNGRFFQQGEKISYGRLPFGFGAMIVGAGDGLAVVSADGVQDKLAVGTGNAGLLLTTKNIADWIRFFVINPGTNNAPLEVAVSGSGAKEDPYVVGVSAATNGSAAITSTASQVKAALEADEDINAVLDVALAGTGASVIVAFAEAALVKDSAALRFDGLVGHSSSAGDISNEAFNDSELCNLITEGVAWAPCLEAVNAMDAVRIRLVDSGASKAGMFCKTAVANETALVSGVRFYGSFEPGNVELEVLPTTHTITMDV